MYNASEGFFAAQNMPDDEGMLFLPITEYFMNLCQWKNMEKTNPQTIRLEPSGIKKNYAPGDQHQWRSVAISCRRYHTVYFSASF